MDTTHDISAVHNHPLPSLPQTIAVAAHDAGGANILIGWFKEHTGSDLRLCLDGPALRLWQEAFGPVETVDITTALDGAELLLSSTSFPHCLEHNARKAAKASGVPSVAVIDHWINYRLRFERDGETCLPDTIWLTDDYAQVRAEQAFPGQALATYRNLYLLGQVAEIKALETAAKDTSLRVLYLLEPIRNSWIPEGESGEFLALDYFMANLQRLGLDQTAQIHLRPHPSDPPKKYDQWVQDQTNWDIHVDEASSLAHGIAQADVVVGCESNALVIATLAGKRTVSTLPPAAPPCRLPFESIVHLRDL